MTRKTSAPEVPGVTASTESQERRSPNTPQLEFQNEEAALRNAVALLETGAYNAPHLSDWERENNQVIKNLVPRLLEAYAELWGMSMELTKLIKDEREGVTPSGLVIPK